jgi:two-component system LytT family sensor kinase
MSSRARLWIALTVVFTAIGLLNFGHFWLDDLTRQRPGTLEPRFIEEMTGAYAALAIMPLVIWIGLRTQWTRATWLGSASLLVAGWAAYTLLHTTLLALSRAVIFPLVGLGGYDYGNLLFRYPMEASNDIVSYSIFIGFVYFFKRLDDGRKAQIEAAHLQQKLAEAKLENLHLQLHPHFLFNTLNAISAVMYDDVAKADAMLAKLSDFLRTVLATSDVREVPIEEEVRVERMYVDIMRARLERGLQMSVVVDPSAAKASVPFMLLQPLLENSIRHGMAGQRDTLAIAVEARRVGDGIVVTVADDGVGFATPANGHAGHGLANVESRLAYFYDGRAFFEIAPGADGGTTATLRFPFKEAAAP